jgi:hypothetical protein
MAEQVQILANKLMISLMDFESSCLALDDFIIVLNNGARMTGMSTEGLRSAYLARYDRLISDAMCRLDEIMALVTEIHVQS